MAYVKSGLKSQLRINLNVGTALDPSYSTRTIGTGYNVKPAITLAEANQTLVLFGTLLNYPTNYRELQQDYEIKEEA